MNDIALFFLVSVITIILWCGAIYVGKIIADLVEETFDRIFN